MNIKRIQFALLLVVVALLLTGCTALPVANFPGVSAVKDTIYVSYGGSVLALDSANGSQKWRYPANVDIARQFFSAPVAANGYILAGSHNNTFYALDAANGSEKWSFIEARGKWIASPLVVGTTIYAPNGDGTLYTFNMEGKPGWKLPTGAGIWTRPMTDGKQLFVLSQDRNLYGVSMQTGEVLWKKDLGASIMYDPLLTTDGFIYATTIAHQVVAVNTATHEFAWQAPFQSKGPVWGTPVLIGSNLFVADETGKFYSINASTGVGTGEWDITPGVVATGAATAKGLIFVTTNGDVVGISEKGEKFLNQKINGKLYSPPVVAGETFLVGVLQGEKVLVAYDTTGKEIWSVAAPK